MAEAVHARHLAGDALPAGDGGRRAGRSDTPRNEAPRDEAAERRERGARRTARILAVIVLALYFGFISYAVLSSRHRHTPAAPGATPAGAPAAGQAAPSRRPANSGY
jgi:hypothetical protein